MIQRSIKRLSWRALVVDDELTRPTAEGRATRALVQELQGRAIEVVEAASAEDGSSVIVSDSAIHAILVDWTLGDHNGGHCQRRSRPRRANLIKLVRSRNDKIPIFLMAERGEASSIPDGRHGDGGRVHLDAGGHGGLRRRPGGRPPSGATWR